MPPDTKPPSVTGSISSRFSYTLIGVVTVILFFFALAGILFTVSRMESRLESRLMNAVKLAEISLPTPLWNMDGQVANNFVEALFLDNATVYARLNWGDGLVTQKSRPGFTWPGLENLKRKDKATNNRVISKSADIFYDKTKVGQILIVLSRHQVREQILLQIYAIIALTFFIIAAIWVTSVLLTRRYIAHPLAKLQKSASQIAQGSLNINVDTSAMGEIGRLAHDQDVMRESLKNLFNELNLSKQKIEEYSRDLERKVAERTRDLTQTVEELKALSEVSQAVNSTLELEKVLERIVHHAVQLSGADSATIYEMDIDNRVFLPRINLGVNQEFIRAMRKSGLRVGDNTVIGKAAGQGKPYQITDLKEVPDYPVAYMKQTDFRTLLALPIQHRDSLVGGLVMRRREPRDFSARVVGLLEAFAGQSALAIHNALLFRKIEEKGRELEAANRHKSEFLANMSHELRTPMNAILGYTELIMDNIYGEVPEKIHEVLERLEHNGRHLLNLINDVLDLSKIEAGKLVLSLNDYSMASVVHMVMTSLGSLAGEKGLSLTADVAAELPQGKGDEQRISQVLLNLVGNVIKFTDQGEVKITAGLDGQGFLVSVIDTGPGLSETEQEKIFRKFHQTDSSLTKKKGGTGLGLSIAKKIIHMHGGRIWVESAPGRGSTFRFSLPVRVEEAKVV